MDTNCRDYRVVWLDDPLAASTLQHECETCVRWQHGVERGRRALAELSRVDTPQELRARVEAELAGDRSRRLERVLGSLVRRTAPEGLDEWAAGQVDTPRAGDEERGRQKAEVLRALDIQAAPPVLERLLNEELELPLSHQATRFPGELGRLKAPPALDARMEAHARRRGMRRLLLAPALTLAAAGLVVWLVARQPGPAPRVHRITVVQAGPGELDPLTRRLAEGLSGFVAGEGEAR